eukprot:TRINITY_DN11181_c0_g1_i1.p1 TRINITY_DN11181_c0_g1~~TRINITY_DN11181_c0_g1_i1.p1  ORF type:complete len:274 (-),score=109.24 TRINITY_DN11181_c0_g1_i1:51-767(-)
MSLVQKIVSTIRLPSLRTRLSTLTATKDFSILRQDLAHSGFGGAVLDDFDRMVEAFNQGATLDVKIEKDLRSQFRHDDPGSLTGKTANGDVDFEWYKKNVITPGVVDKYQVLYQEMKAVNDGITSEDDLLSDEVKKFMTDEQHGQLRKFHEAQNAIRDGVEASFDRTLNELDELVEAASARNVEIKSEIVVMEKALTQLTDATVEDYLVANPELVAEIADDVQNSRWDNCYNEEERVQ